MFSFMLIPSLHTQKQESVALPETSLANIKMT